ncbi:hypothetical protein CICLE_v10024469mg [Citrus x clementina]|uniref:Retrovirus-related Pol polyprotein from transposon TNT 1-94 n=1 Tax=Citrus clementina TaxID=85681 RepID=V4T3P7_CITCL|nr:hypothetical protein CICLE_v10024469mg [Citrus x clementina]
MLKIEGQRLKDSKAKNYILQAIDRSILDTILCKDTSKMIWDSMKKKYQGSIRLKRQQLQALRTEFELLQSKDIDELSIDELHGSLLVHEQKFSREDKEEQALKASTNNNVTSPNR